MGMVNEKKYEEITRILTNRMSFGTAGRVPTFITL